MAKIIKVTVQRNISMVFKFMSAYLLSGTLQSCECCEGKLVFNGLSFDSKAKKIHSNLFFCEKKSLKCWFNGKYLNFLC